MAIEVVDGPQSLLNKVAHIRLEPDLHSRIEYDYSDSRSLGRAEFLVMFGDFEGLEKFSRAHIVIFDHLNQGNLRIEDKFSTNGTEFPNGNRGREVIAILADVLKIKASWSNKNFTIIPGEFIVPAPRLSVAGFSPPQVMDDKSLMDLISSELSKLAKKTGMSWQLRRSWDVREKQVELSTLSDYEWKIIPKEGLSQYFQEIEGPLIPGEHYDPEFFQGHYYLVFVKNGDLFFKHSGHYAGFEPDRAEYYVVLKIGWLFNSEGNKLNELLMKWIKEYPPSFYSCT